MEKRRFSLPAESPAYGDTAFVIGMVIVGVTLASSVVPSIRDAETA